MFKHIDRLMIVGYFKSYFICLISLLTLYIVVDLFTNLDDFVQAGAHGLQVVAMRIVSYYGYRIPQFFDRLCEAIVLLAAMFTVAMMQRNNEQVPLLSSGVPTQRIVAPVLVCACLMMTLTVLNQEMLIPRIGQIFYGQFAFQHQPLQIESNHHMQVIGHFICDGANQRGLDFVDRLVERR